MPRTPLGDDWPNWTDEQLLDLRMSQLPLSIEGTLASRTDQLRAEIRVRGLNLPLHFDLADE